MRPCIGRGMELDHHGAPDDSKSLQRRGLPRAGILLFQD